MGPAELVSNVIPSGKAGRISIRYTWRQQFNNSTCQLTQTNKFFILEQSSQILLIKGGEGGEGSIYYNEKKIAAQPRKPRQHSTAPNPYLGLDNNQCFLAGSKETMGAVTLPTKFIPSREYRCPVIISCCPSSQETEGGRPLPPRSDDDGPGRGEAGE